MFQSASGRISDHQEIKRLGKFTCSFATVRFGTLHYSSLEWDKILALKFAKGKFDKKMKVSQAGKMDILW